MAAYSLFSEVGHGKKADRKSVRLKEVLSALPSYRNAAVGHGAVRPLEFYDPAAETLTSALEELWRCNAFWPQDSALVHVESIEVDSSGVRRARVFDLSGLGATVVSPRGVTGLGEEVLPSRLFLRHGDEYLPLHPWVIFSVNELQETVSFFNGRRRSSRYLDYVSGEELRGAELLEGFPSIEDDLALALQGTARGDEEPDDAGEYFAGYELYGKLGAGGMGVVYVARQRSLDRLVALKVLPDQVSDNRTAVARFHREIHALSRCEHPNVVKILASGVHEGSPYYAMELIEGADLSAVSRAAKTESDLSLALRSASDSVRSVREEALRKSSDDYQAAAPAAAPKLIDSDRTRELVKLFRDAASGVHHLHEQGIIHRDLKPGNLMITESDRRVVIMDLGLAMMGDASQSITRDGNQILGTLRYMPPEQLQRNLLTLDRRADVYSLGATFYELLTSKLLFDGDSDVRLIEQVLRQAPVPAKEANPALPTDVATILDKATQKEAKLRYDTAEALAADLDAFLDGRPIAARPPSVGYLLRLAIKRHRTLSLVIALAAVLVVSAIGFYLVDKQRSLKRERALRENETQLREEADVILARSLEERGRTELAYFDRPFRAAVLLAEAYRRDPSNVATRSMLAEAMRPIDALTHQFDEVGHRAWRLLYSPDGQWLAATFDDKTVRVWDASKGALVHTVKTRGGASLAFSGDSKILAIGASDVELLRLGSGESIDTVKTSGNDVTFIPNSLRFLAHDSEPPIELWEAGSPSKKLADLDAARFGVYQVEVNRDGALIAGLGSTRQTPIYGSDGALLFTLEHPKTADQLVFSPDSKSFAVLLDDGVIQLFRLASRELIAELKVPPESSLFGAGLIEDVRFSRDSDLIFGFTSRNELLAWRTTTGKEVGEISGAGTRTRRAQNRRGARYVELEGRTARILDNPVFGRDAKRIVASVSQVKPVVEFTLSAHRREVSAAALSPDATQLATADTMGAVFLWSLVKPRRIVEVIHREAIAESAAFSPDGSRVAVVGGSALLLRADDGNTLTELVGHKDVINSVAFSSDGNHIATASDDKTVQVWDGTFGKRLVEITGHTSLVYRAAFSPVAPLLATASDDKTIKVWDLSGNDPGAVASPMATCEHDGEVYDFRFSPDGRWLVSDHGTIWSVDCTSTKELGPAGKDTRHAIAISPDSRLVALSSKNDVEIYSIEDARLLYRLTGHGDRVLSLQFASDGLLASGSADRTARVWRVNATSGELLSVCEGHVSSVSHLAFTSDNQRLATSAREDTRLWAASTGDLLSVLPGSGGQVRFSKDDTRLIVSGGFSARLWDIGLEHRQQKEIDALLESRVPWRLLDGRIVPR